MPPARSWFCPRATRAPPPCCACTIPARCAIPARSRAYLEDFELPEGDDAAGAFMVLPEGDACAPAVLRMHDTRRLRYPGAKPRVLSEEARDGGVEITLTADGYIHGVHCKENLALSDNYFDLVPGQVKKVFVRGTEHVEWHTVR